MILTWAQVRKIAFGPLALKPWEFRALSWTEFWEMYSGWQFRREMEHEHTRYLASMMVNTSFNAPKKPIQPKQLYRLPEIDGEPAITTAESLERFRQKISRQLGKEIHFVKTAAA